MLILLLFLLESGALMTLKGNDRANIWGDPQAKPAMSFLSLSALLWSLSQDSRLIIDYYYCYRIHLYPIPHFPSIGLLIYTFHLLCNSKTPSPTLMSCHGLSMYSLLRTEMLSLDAPLPLYAILFPVSGALIICLVVQPPCTKAWFLMLCSYFGELNELCPLLVSRIGRYGASLPVSSFHGLKNFRVFVSHFLLNSAIKHHLAPGPSCFHQVQNWSFLQVIYPITYTMATKL